jgi:hypothetical protein
LRGNAGAGRADHRHAAGQRPRHHSLTATGVSSGSLATSALTVVAADAGSAAVGGNDGLAFTGSTVPTLVIWGAAGAVLLGIALMVVLTLQRRARSNA